MTGDDGERDEEERLEARIALVSSSRTWKPWQAAAAFVLLVVGIVMYVVDHLDMILFGKLIDFGYLPLGLVLVGIYVMFGLDVVSAFRGGK